MSIEKTREPYEFLCRWTDGKLTGAHIRFLERVTEDGVVLLEKEGPALPVSVGERDGFPLSEAFDLMHIGALKEVDTERGRCMELEQKISDMEQAAKALEAVAAVREQERDSALNVLAQVRALIATE